MLLHLAAWVSGCVGQTAVVLAAWRETPDWAHLRGPAGVNAFQLVVASWVLRHPSTYYRNR